MVTRIIFILFSSAFLFGSMVSMVDAEYDKSAQTIKITQDMKDWIGTHFDRKVTGEYISVSEIEFQEGRFYLKVLSGNRKVLRRMVKSAAEAKEMLKEINNGGPLINYIDKIIETQHGADKKPGAYDDRGSGDGEIGQKLSNRQEIKRVNNTVQADNSLSKARSVAFPSDQTLPVTGTWTGKYVCGWGASWTEYDHRGCETWFFEGVFPLLCYS